MSNLLSIEALQTKADALAAEINAANPAQTFIYVVHNTGQLQSNLQLIEESILDHPAGHIARKLIRRNFAPAEPSGLLGVSGKQTTNWVGFSSFVSTLTLISINIDQYDHYFDALSDLFRQTWHGIEVADICVDPIVLERLGNRPMIPKRSPIGEARANLRGDIFAALMLKTEGYQDAIDVIAKKRALQTITRESRDPPEKFPFILAVTATNYATEEIIPRMDQDRPRVIKCKDVTEEIVSATSDDQIRQWWRFCEPSQDMAWRGYKPEVIVSASLNHGDDPYVRAITHLVQDFSGIQPCPPEQIEYIFNPFIDIHRNEQTHQALIQETFEHVLSEGLDTESSEPLLATAAQQNQDLLQGRFLGWCAAALQGAARAFDTAAIQGRPLAQAAQLEFEMLKSGPPLTSLYKLTHEIISRQKSGDVVLLDRLPELVKELPDLDVLSKSLFQTREYLKKAEYTAEISANDLDIHLTPAGQTLAQQFETRMKPQIPAEFAFSVPASSPPPSMPSLGFGYSSLQAFPQEYKKPPTPSSTEKKDLILSADQETGLSLEFDDANQKQDE